jgi:hypothetical protein
MHFSDFTVIFLTSYLNVMYPTHVRFRLDCKQVGRRSVMKGWVWGHPMFWALIFHHKAFILPPYEKGKNRGSLLAFCNFLIPPWEIQYGRGLHNDCHTDEFNVVCLSSCITLISFQLLRLTHRMTFTNNGPGWMNEEAIVTCTQILSWYSLQETDKNG